MEGEGEGQKAGQVGVIGKETCPDCGLLLTGTVQKWLEKRGWWLAALTPIRVNNLLPDEHNEG